MTKHQKQIFALAVILVFTATVLVLTGLSEAGKGDKPDPVMDMLEDIYDIVLDTNSKIPPIEAGVPRTGVTTSYATGDDGDLERGVTWPNPRFTDNLNGTVTDNLTGLIWLKNANRFGLKNWVDALNDCNTLADDGVDLTDGSVAGDWRMSNIRELLSLFLYSFHNPALPNTAGTGQWSEGDPFDNVKTDRDYWTSNTDPGNSGSAKHVGMYQASSGGHATKTTALLYVWPVRGGN